MGKIRAIVLVTLGDILRRKILYLALILLVISLYFTFQRGEWIEMAKEAGEAEMAQKVRVASVHQVIGLFTGFGVFLSLFFASTALAADVKEKTLAAILARPVARWEYLFGKWLGVIVFVSGFMSIGIAMGLVIAAVYRVTLPGVFWMGVLESYVKGILFTGVSIGLSVRLAPVLAGTAALFLTLMPGWFDGDLTNPNLLTRSLASAIYFLCPAKMPVELLDFEKETRDPNYGLYARILLENALYGVAILIMGCHLFSRRDAPVK